MSVLGALEPARVMHYFEEICGIPHGSGNTKKISDYCVSFAKEHHLTYLQDEYNNVIIWKDGLYFRWCGKVGKNQKLSYKGADRFGNLGAGLYSWYGDKCKIGSRIKII